MATLSAVLVVALGYLLCCVSAQAAVLDPDLAAELATRAPQDEISVIVALSDRVDHRLFKLRDRNQRDTDLVKALKAKAAATQAGHRVFLENNGAWRLRELWLINGMAVTAPAGVIRRLAARPGIGGIRLDSILEAPVTTLGAASPPEWNLNLVHAPELWSLGHTGAGVVVANMDTGVDAAHPDLAARWRGGGNSWYDPHGQHATPHDSDGHGTQTMAIMVGGDAGGSAIGMAPGAQWIAARLYNDAGVASYSDIHLAFQWLLDPDGDANTLDAPDVVNASWGLAGSAGQCNTEFSADIDTLRTAGIAVVFAAGNDGPAPQTSLSPANNPQSFSTGAIDASLAIASFSSRGESACDGSIYPKLAMPGVNINTADLSFGGMPLYVAVSGTSYAAPHAAGAMALLAGAFPGADVAQIEAALTQSASDLGAAGADNSYGHGLANVLAAYQALAAGGSPPVMTSTPPLAMNDAYGMSAGSTLSVAAPGVLGNDSDADADALSAALVSGTANGSLAFNGDGSFSYTPNPGFAGSDSFVYRAHDGALYSNDATASITVNANKPPVAGNDNVVARKRSGSLYTAKAINVLGNDYDPDGSLDPASVSIVAAPDKGGTLAVNGKGQVFYTPRQNFVGIETFMYTVRDLRGAASNAAKVTVIVKW